ncbi:MAG: diguanylate cyclase [Gallionella sp.]|nr:diguanylate cyclase [Gallionella sp.]
MRLTGSVGRKLGVLISSALIVTFVLTAVWFDDLAHRNLDKFLHQQARMLYQQIVLTRSWNASYGGVYVRKQPGMETNRYLYEVGPGHGEKSTVVPEITDTNGNVYTLKNPALMSRELSELTAKNADIRFHLTSLKTINPNNAPDDFEMRSLKKFESGLKEASEFSYQEGKNYYRFMAPLYVEQSCLRCHGFQDYKIGEVRGGISLTLPMDNELELLKAGSDRFITTAVILLALVIGIIILGSYYVVTRPLRILQRFANNMGTQQQLPDYLISRRDEVGLLARELTSANTELLVYHEQISERTTQLEYDNRTDPLTGLCNRRHLFSEGGRLYERWRYDGTRIAVLMIDIDHFKRINDKYGHQVGDGVLAETARVVKQQCRPNDLVARYGGEEFVVMLEAPSPGSGVSTARRILQSIIENPINLEQGELHVTASIGVAEGDNLGDFDSALRKADEALYQAKDSGRNRVATYNKSES